MMGKSTFNVKQKLVIKRTSVLYHKNRVDDQIYTFSHSFTDSEEKDKKPRPLLSYCLWIEEWPI